MGSFVVTNHYTLDSSSSTATTVTLLLLAAARSESEVVLSEITFDNALDVCVDLKKNTWVQYDNVGIVTSHHRYCLY